MSSLICVYTELPLSILRGDIVKNISVLLDALNTLRVHLINQQMPAQYKRLQGVLARQECVDLFCKVFYENGQNSREAIKAHGVIATDTRGIQLANDVNQYKARLEELLEALRKHPEGKRMEYRDIGLERELEPRSDLYKEALAKGGNARLHIKQATRQIHVLDPAPKRIGFSWATQDYSKKSLSYEKAKKKTRQALVGAEAKNDHIEAESLKRDMDVLSRMPEHAQFVQQLAQLPHVVSSVDGIKHRASMPFLINLENGGWPREIGSVPDEPPTQHHRLRRTDRTIGDRPVVEKLGIYLQINHDKKQPQSVANTGVLQDDE